MLPRSDVFCTYVYNSPMKPYYEHAGIAIYCGDARAVTQPGEPSDSPGAPRRRFGEVDGAGRLRVNVDEVYTAMRKQVEAPGALGDTLSCSGCGREYDMGEGEELRHHMAECDGEAPGARFPADPFKETR